MQEVGLVLVLVNCSSESPRITICADRAPCIVPSCNRLAAEQCTPLPDECTKLHRRVAADARARRLAAEIRANKWLKHRGGKLALKILNVERDLQLVGYPSCVVCRIKRAATLPSPIHAIRSIVQAHPHANNLMSGLNKKCGRNRRVHTAREGNEHTL
jgi:hypothetical protein